MRTPHGRAAVKAEPAAYATEAIWEGAAGARGLSQKTCTEQASPRELAQRSARGPCMGAGRFSYINLLPYAWRAARYPHEISRCGDGERAHMQRNITRKSINEYKEYLLAAEKAKATVTKYINEAERLAEYLNGNQLSKRALLEYREILAENFSSRTVNTKLAAINGYLSFIGADEYKVQLLKVQRRAFIDESRELSAVEYKRLVNAADAGGNERLSLVMQTICATGIRISELSYITTDAIEKRQTEIRLKGKSRTVLIPNKLCKKLAEYATRQHIDSGVIFRTKGGRPIDRANVCHDMKRLCDAAHVEQSKVFPHNLRHLFARAFYSVEKNLPHLADVLGHSSIETTRIYVAASSKQHERTLERMKLIT